MGHTCLKKISTMTACSNHGLLIINKINLYSKREKLYLLSNLKYIYLFQVQVHKIHKLVLTILNAITDQRVLNGIKCTTKN